MPRLPFRSILAWSAAAFLAAATASAAPPSPKVPRTETATPAGLSDPAEITGFKYRSIGPAWGGRVSMATGVPGDPLTFYAATASGGVWKSSDGGANWRPVFDDQPISSTGSIAVAASDPNVVYVGSGEANIRGNVGAGNGIYKSTDAGKSWKHVWTQEGQIGAMAVDPRNADVAFAAVLGHAFGPNPERGVYRTRDGGKSWQQVLKKDADTGASDVALDPSNPNIVFAGLWQARRYPWDLTSGGPGSGLYVSRDGGDSWTQLKGKGLPDGIWGKVGVAVAPSNGRRVYAQIEAEKGGLFRSDDGGESWTLATDSRELRQRAWYYSRLAVSPANPNEVWAPNVPLLKSIDAGRTFKHITNEAHGDNHDVWIDPKDARRLIVSNDGGVEISTDGGETWKSPPLPIGQFYHVSVDNRVPYQVAGALQDIGTSQGPSDSLAGGISNGDWHGVGGGEAGWVVSDPSDPNIVYAGEYLGYLSRYDNRTNEARNVSPWPENPSGWGGVQMRYRFQWTAPIAISPHDPKTVYYGGNVLFRSRDGGQHWDIISPDLTRDDKSKEQWAGGPITGDNTGVETYCTIFVVAESPVQKDLIWAGTDDGRVHLTRDGGAHWEEVTAALTGLPAWGTVDMIEPSRYDAGTAYLVVDAHRLDDMHPYLWKTTDFGKSWKRLDGGLPRDVYLHSVREDPQVKGLLYLATERGVAYSKDDGATWKSLKLNLPTVAVHDLQVKGDDLVLATHGRSMWIFDDLGALRQLGSDVTGKDVALLASPEAVRWTGIRRSARTGWTGQNPPRGANLYYWLKDEPKGDVRIDILDSTGTLVFRMSSKPAELTGSTEYTDEERELLDQYTLTTKTRGLQHVSWPLVWSGAEMIRGGVLDSGYPLLGPTVLPGTYTARLTVDGKTASTQIRVVPDPRSTVSPEALAKQFRFAMQVRDAVTRLTRTAEQLRSVRRQIAARNDLLANDPKAEPLIRDSKALLTRIDDLEGRLHNPTAQVTYDVLAMKGGARLYSRMAPFFDWVKEGDGEPTQGMEQVFAGQQQELDKMEAEWRGIASGDLAKLNETARGLGLPEIYLPPLAPAGASVAPAAMLVSPEAAQRDE
jgi:photosystem II stability/assembly factor-like uncharacterized protein